PTNPPPQIAVHRFECYERVLEKCSTKPRNSGVRIGQHCWETIAENGAGKKAETGKSLGSLSFLTETSLESRTSARPFCALEVSSDQLTCAREETKGLYPRAFPPRQSSHRPTTYRLPTLLFSSSIGARHGPHRHALHWLPSP